MTEPADTPAPVRWLTPDERAAWLALTGVLLLLPSALDSQMQRDRGITMFEYIVMAMLSEVPEHTLQLKVLAQLSNSSLSRLSHVVTRLELRGWVRRTPSAADGRVSVATLTDEGYDTVVAAAPGHVTTVRELVFDGLAPGQVAELQSIARSIVRRLDPEGRVGPAAP